MKSSQVLLAAAALGAAFVTTVSAASSVPNLRSAVARNRHVVVVYSLGELLPGHILVATRAQTAPNGKLLKANVRLNEQLTGTGCTNPPPGANFYPIYSTGVSAEGRNGHCVWQFGGPYIKGTTNTFGGNSTAEFGPLLFTWYPNPNPAIRYRTNNYRNVLSSNPCPA